MPEGDAVLRTARRLDRALTGGVLTRTDVRVPRYATVDLAGQPVTGTVTRGKHLLTRIGADWTLHTHLKMDGSWATLRPGQRWPKPAHMARVVLETDATQAVGFLLGIVEVLPRAGEEEAVGHLGPDLLGADWDEDEAVRRLLTHPDEPVFDALRDQTSLAGLGTIWAAETGFTMGIHPMTRVGDVPDLVRTVRVARLKLQQAMERPGPLAVYGRERAVCRRCGTPIRRIEMGGREGRPRPAYFCPNCQPAR
ncbi:DNA-formamidopyrimidine glycosylase family protein [Nocardioides sp. CER19]|uniref:DNA-formamidopyrimidine glycosylase family protein n=1 Tax=Nocardioides sp. CER19 TaxID=3038538 RepID=UPI002448E9A9|nr:DNA-formamidopyrimidine glycosylase family protein [Nocardioides sp. CER19]MDH2415861.1 DNA-formamidopyrimidine glycosylase family protein [Nocardioides sp. CER19]